MSKLGDRIQRALRQERRPIGFGMRNVAPQPTLIILARMAKPLPNVPEGIAGSIDAVLLSGITKTDKSVTDFIKALASVPCGIQLPESSVVELDVVRNAKDSGADYIVFRPEATDAASLTVDGIGFVVAVTKDAPEDSLRFLEGMGFDAAIVDGDLQPLTVQKLISLRRLAILTRLPLVVPWQRELSREALEALRNNGVIGFIADVASWGDITPLAELRESILALPPRRREERREALLPSVTPSPPAEEEDHEDDDD